MSITSPRIVHLKSLLALEEKRTALQGQIDDIEQQILSIRDQILGQAPSTVARAVRKIAAKGGRAQRGALKAQILSALESAGHAGVRVVDLAESLGTKAANLHAWFHATTKRMPSIVKVAGGHYRLNGNGAKPSAAPATAAEKFWTSLSRGCWCPTRPNQRTRQHGAGGDGRFSGSVCSATAAAVEIFFSF